MNTTMYCSSRIPYSIYILDWTNTLLMVGGVRSGTRLMRERLFPPLMGRKPQRVMILVASESCLVLARAIHGQIGLNMQVVGVLNPNSIAYQSLSGWLQGRGASGRRGATCREVQGERHSGIDSRGWR